MSPNIINPKSTSSGLAIVFVPESPKFLIEQNRMEDADAAMTKISWFGGTSYNPLELRNIIDGVLG